MGADVRNFAEKDPENFLKLIQNQGQAVFVPSKYYHQVKNIKNTCSINHNWINGTNLKFVSEHLEEEMIKIKKSISHLEDGMEDFYEHIQKLLKIIVGMDLKDFYDF